MAVGTALWVSATISVVRQGGSEELRKVTGVLLVSMLLMHTSTDSARPLPVNVWQY